MNDKTDCCLPLHTVLVMRHGVSVCITVSKSIFFDVWLQHHDACQEFSCSRWEISCMPGDDAGTNYIHRQEARLIDHARLWFWRNVIVSCSYQWAQRHKRKWHCEMVRHSLQDSGLPRSSCIQRAVPANSYIKWFTSISQKLSRSFLRTWNPPWGPWPFRDWSSPWCCEASPNSHHTCLPEEYRKACSWHKLPHVTGSARPQLQHHGPSLNRYAPHQPSSCRGRHWTTRWRRWKERQLKNGQAGMQMGPHARRCHSRKVQILSLGSQCCQEQKFSSPRTVNPHHITRLANSKCLKDGTHPCVVHKSIKNGRWILCHWDTLIENAKVGYRVSPLPTFRVTYY